jgi:hypothetical protein
MRGYVPLCCLHGINSNHRTEVVTSLALPHYLPNNIVLSFAGMEDLKQP